MEFKIGLLKRLGMLAILVLVVFVMAGWTNKIYYTKKNWAACFTKEDLDKVLTYQNQRDTSAIQNLIDTNRCLLIKEDVPVFVKNISLGVIKVRPRGTPLELYMLREAIK